MVQAQRRPVHSTLIQLSTVSQVCTTGVQRGGGGRHRTCVTQLYSVSTLRAPWLSCNDERERERAGERASTPAPGPVPALPVALSSLPSAPASPALSLVLPRGFGWWQPPPALSCPSVPTLNAPTQPLPCSSAAPSQRPSTAGLEAVGSVKLPQPPWTPCWPPAAFASALARVGAWIPARPQPAG